MSESQTRLTKLRIAAIYVADYLLKNYVALQEMQVACDMGEYLPADQEETAMLNTLVNEQLARVNTGLYVICLHVTPQAIEAKYVCLN